MKNPKFIQASPEDSIDRVNKYSKSISATDYDTPYSFDVWLQNFGLAGGAPEKREIEYKEYLSRWNATKETEKINTSYKQQYIDYLKQLTYTYTFTQDERRIAKTTDYDNEFEIDAVSYMFAKRTKQVCEYIRSQRNELKFQSVKTQHRCTSAGVELIIYNDVLRMLEDEEIKTEYANLLSSQAGGSGELDDLKRELRVQLTELYDVEEGYYGAQLDESFTELPRGVTASIYNRLTFDPYIFIDEGVAINNILKSYSVQTDLSLESGNIMTLPMDSNITSITDLPPNEFIEYVSSREGMTLSTTRKLIQRSIGTSLYYTKTDSTAQIEDTGLLVEPTSPVHNTLNRGVPAINVVSNTNTKTRTIQQIGGFYTPNKLGVLTYASIGPGVSIDHDRLESDTLYIYPDPTIYYTNVETYNFTEYSPIPIKFSEKVKWQKATKACDAQSGDIIDSQKLQKFYNYSSDTEINKHSKFGISRFDDPYDFWSGDKSDIWANADVYIADQLKELPIQSRQESLLTNSGQVDKWRTDIYGNEFALIKQIDSYTTHEDPIIECDKAKYQDGTGCRIYDGTDLKNVLTGLPVYELGVDGGTTHPVIDISENLADLIHYGMDCNGGVCQPGSRWLTDSMLNPGRASGFSSFQKYDDIANAGYFLPNLCLDAEQESGLVFCRVVDGYSVEVPSRYSETDYYELSGTWFEGFSEQGGDFYDPPFDDLWDGGLFNTVCTAGLQGPIYKQNISTKYTDTSLIFSTTESTSDDTTTPIDDSTIHSTGISTGTLQVREITSRYTKNSTEILTDILSVVPDTRMVNYRTLNPREQLTHHLIDFDVINDIIILYSDNFIYLNKFNYDYDTGHMSPDHTSGVLIEYDRETDIPVKHFYNESSNEIIIGVLRYLDKDVTGDIYSTLAPTHMYRVPVTSLTLSPKKLAWNAADFIVPTTVMSVDTTGYGYITYNEQLNYYYVTSAGKLTDSIASEQFYVYQIRFSLDRDVPTAVTNIRPELYTSGSLSNSDTESADLENTNTLSVDDSGLLYFNLDEYLTDQFQTQSFDYDTVDRSVDQKNENWINNRLTVNSPRDHNIGSESHDGAFVALFPPGEVKSFHLKLNITTIYTLAESTDQVYKIEARFARPDISESHVDTVEFSRSPLPDFSSIDITKLINTDDLTDPRQNTITYEYNFESSPSQCSDVVVENCVSMAHWDNPSGSIAPTAHVGRLYKFIIILHGMSGQRYYYPFKFILSPFNAGNCLNDVQLVNVSSFVDTEFHESSLLIFESQNPRYVAPVVLRTEALDKITFYSSEVTESTNIQSTSNINYMSKESSSVSYGDSISSDTQTTQVTTNNTPTPVVSNPSPVSY